MVLCRGSHESLPFFRHDDSQALVVFGIDRVSLGLNPVRICAHILVNGPTLSIWQSRVVPRSRPRRMVDLAERVGTGMRNVWEMNS
jgi:hypothetical protein